RVSSIEVRLRPVDIHELLLCDDVLYSLYPRLPTHRRHLSVEIIPLVVVHEVVENDDLIVAKAITTDDVGLRATIAIKLAVRALATDVSHHRILLAEIRTEPRTNAKRVHHDIISVTSVESKLLPRALDLSLKQPHGASSGKRELTLTNEYDERLVMVSDRDDGERRSAVRDIHRYSSTRKRSVR